MRDAAMAFHLRRLAIGAGAAIMAVRAGGALGTRSKRDASPVTEADLAADAVIAAGLADAYPALPMVSEERAETHAPLGAASYFLVDPLDGTREFVRRRGAFTVNIALIEDGSPTAGIVYAPALGRLFRTDPGGGAVEERGAMDPAREGDVRAIAAVAANPARLRVLGSRSHLDAATQACIDRLAPLSLTRVGSSIKFGLLAAGEADLYPRFGPTMEWDTAAGHAVLAAAGGHVLRLPDMTPLRYGAADRRNPAFIATGLSGPPHLRR